MRHIIVTIFVLLVLGSCNRNIFDYGGYTIEYDTEFGKNLILTYADTISYHYWEDGSTTQKEGVFLKYHVNGNIDTMFIWKGAIVIESHIYNIKSDSNYITIDQKPLDLIFGKIESKEFNPNRPMWPGNAKEAENIIRESSIHKYWVISKKTRDVYGGYEKEEFDLLCKRLKVPQELRFIY